jgi:hypothetical protein
MLGMKAARPSDLFRLNKGRVVMREKCVSIDAKIAQYREVFADVDDRTARILVDLVIEDFEAEKKQLHAEASTIVLADGLFR